MAVNIKKNQLYADLTYFVFNPVTSRILLSLLLVQDCSNSSELAMGLL